MNTIEEVVVRDTKSFLEEIVPVMGHRRIPFYRGIADRQELLPKLLRMEIGKTEFATWSELEGALIERFKARGQGELGFEPSSELEWHILATHHGLPTRFTSWSENGLVALWFATAPGSGDGEVWRVLPGDDSFVVTQDFQVDPEEHRVYHPRHTNPEILAQRTCFLSHPLPKLDTRPISFENHYEHLEDKDYSLHLARITIPEEDKGTIRAQLSRLGVDERALFPGLRGLANQIAAEAYYHTGSYDWVF